MTRPSKGVEFDDMLDALGHVQRRRLLMALLERDPQDDLLVIITDSESNEKALEQLPELQHRHLPKLDRYGFIEWEQEASDISEGENFDDIRLLLKFLDQHEDELPADCL